MSTNEEEIIEAREKSERLHPNDIEEAGLDDINQVITPQIIRKEKLPESASEASDPTEDFGIESIQSQLDFDLSENQRRRLRNVYGSNPIAIADTTVDQLASDQEGTGFLIEENASFLEDAEITREEIESIIEAAETVVDNNNLREATEEFEEAQEPIKDRLVVEPVYTEKFRARTENDNREHKSLCGQKFVEPVGEDEWNITIEGIVTESQLLDLIEMRPADNELKIVANPVGQKFTSVTFDRFTYELTDELNTGEFGSGEVPLAEFQLQSQDDQA